MMTEDEAKKKELAQLTNIYALSGLLSGDGDESKARAAMGELNNRINQRSRRRAIRNNLKYAAAVCLLVVSTWYVTYRAMSVDKAPSYTEVKAPKGQRVNVMLADGTSVWLSPRSTLRIPNEFQSDERSVELDGEGFFDVTKNAQCPFIVKTGQYHVKVLGTRFNVFAYSEKQKFEACLVEGSVLVYNKDNVTESLRLNPDEKVCVENNQLVKSASRFDNEGYLESGVYSFQSKPLLEILECLSLWYGVHFDVGHHVAVYRKISGKFRQSDEVDNILKALQGAYAFEFKRIDANRIQLY